MKRDRYKIAGKGTKKRMNAGELKPERVDLFEKLLALADENKHINQYV